MPITPAITGLTLRQLADREERAFPTYPQVARYFPAATIEDARGRLGRAIERGDGPGLIIGGPGTGKSLLLQVLASQYHERFDVVLPACARLCTRRALLQAILFELGLPYRVRDEGDLRLSLLDHLLSREESPTGLLLLVDEAQTLSANLLDELRVLTNLVRGGTPRVRLVLAGSSALEESFAHPDLESFSQRLAARCYLAPFGREETIQFVRAQVAACGGSPEALFSGDAWDAIFEATDGVPRLVNQLCDRALIAASAGNREQVDRHSIQTAWAEIQQLPAPWETPPPTTAPPAPLQVVEFGELAETIDRNIHEIDKLIASPGGLANKPDVDEFLVSEPTELDDEEQGPVAGPDTMKGAATVADGADATPADPFAEEFDEEEVVLDNFAGWDNMFRRDAPRVQNRRDPEFAALVQSAISTSDICEQYVAAPARTDFRMLDAELTNCGISTSDLPSTVPGDEVGSLNAASWPPLRLVKIAEPLKHLPVVESDETKLHEERLRCKSPHWNDLVGSSVARDEDPVLIVEDDISAPKSPVRREEYRNLFSRLRGD